MCNNNEDMEKNKQCSCSHGHDGDCGCGCGCEHEEDLEKVTITLEDGTEIECDVLGVFEVSEKEYVALSPEDEDEILFFRYEDDEEGFTMTDIETDEEYEEVSTAFFEVILSDEDFEEDFDDEEYDDEEIDSDDFDDEE